MMELGILLLGPDGDTLDSNGLTLAAGAGSASHVLSALHAEIHAVVWALKELDNLPSTTDIIVEGDSATTSGWLSSWLSTSRAPCCERKTCPVCPNQNRLDSKDGEYHCGQAGSSWEEPVIALYMDKGKPAVR